MRRQFWRLGKHEVIIWHTESNPDLLLVMSFHFIAHLPGIVGWDGDLLFHSSATSALDIKSTSCPLISLHTYFPP